jgi:hypothetical protein
MNCHKVSWYINCTHRKTHELPEDVQERRPKHGAKNKNIVQQVAMTYYICNVVVRKMYSIKDGTLQLFTRVCGSFLLFSRH